MPVDPDLDPCDPAAPLAGHRARRTGRGRADVLAAVAGGGALGALARHGVAQLIHVSKDSFPWATFCTNVSGSLALGFLLILVIERFPPSRYVRPSSPPGSSGPSPPSRPSPWRPTC